MCTSRKANCAHVGPSACEVSRAVLLGAGERSEDFATCETPAEICLCFVLTLCSTYAKFVQASFDWPLKPVILQKRIFPFCPAGHLWQQHEVLLAHSAKAHRNAAVVQKTVPKDGTPSRLCRQEAAIGNVLGGNGRRAKCSWFPHIFEMKCNQRGDQ